MLIQYNAIYLHYCIWAVDRAVTFSSVVVCMCVHVVFVHTCFERDIDLSHSLSCSEFITVATIFYTSRTLYFIICVSN
jgi:hypothetical protein